MLNLNFIYLYSWCTCTLSPDRAEVSTMPPSRRRSDTAATSPDNSVANKTQNENKNCGAEAMVRACECGGRSRRALYTLAPRPLPPRTPRAFMTHTT